MAIVVRLHVFSGRENPVWALSESEAESLGAINTKNAELEGKEAHGLGYRGFSIIETDENKNLGIQERYGADVLNAPNDATFFSHQPEIEDFLLHTGSHIVDEEILAHARDMLRNPQYESTHDKRSGCPVNKGQNAPVYNPGFWNNNLVRLRNNNCYNYANDQATNTFAQPGRGTGQQYNALNCPNVNAAAIRDGLVNVPNFQANTPGWYAALVIWPGRDYHWYRQDDNGCWSHKPGSTPAKNTDNSGNQITDPATADRGPYINFCTYMVTNFGVQIA